MLRVVGLLVFVAVLGGEASNPGAGERQGKPTASPTGTATESQSSISPTVSSNSPVDQLIPWLLNEDRQLRGIAFSEVIFDAPAREFSHSIRKMKRIGVW
jgi:hypothetical protein